MDGGWKMLGRVVSCYGARSLLLRRFQFTASRTYSGSSYLDNLRFSSSLPIIPTSFHKDSEFVSSHSTFQPSTLVSIDRSGLCNHEDDCGENLSKDSELVRHLKGIIKICDIVILCALIPSGYSWQPGLILKDLLKLSEQPNRSMATDCDPKPVPLIYYLAFNKFRGGPISIAEYMEEVLTNPKNGFYINRDVFGADGDFVTSPEVSQMFGEMIGVWVKCLWEQMGRPDKVNLIELGPGRGTLMADLLRGSSEFKSFKESLQIHLVECSPALQTLQHHNLKCVDRGIKEGSLGEGVISLLGGSTPVFWHASLAHVPSGYPTIIIGNEFFDALPIHQFQRTSHGWREKMVDVFENSFRFVLNPHPTPANIYLSKRCGWASSDEIAKLHQIEICPRAMDMTHEICQRIGSDGGGALLIDYGIDGIISDSLQAIRKHKFVNILDCPGSADISGYVDFASVRRCAEEVKITGGKVTVHGPKTQSEFLGAMGINMRTEVLLQNCGDDQVESLKAGYWRLVGEGKAPFWEGRDEKAPIGMGSRYLVMAIVNTSHGFLFPF